MSEITILPFPLSSASIRPGQIIIDPVHAESSSFSPSSPPLVNTSTSNSKYQVTVAHDEYGRFLRTTSDHTHLAADSLLQISADFSSISSIAEPRCAFDALRRDLTALAFFRKAAFERQPLYYVSSIQTLKSPSFTRASITEATTKPIRLPAHVRRHDSAMSLGRSDSAQQDDDESIFGAELLKIKCRVSDASEPHTIDDLDYQWSYHQLDDRSQLCIGFGKALDAKELRAIAGIAVDEDFTDHSWDSQMSDDDDGIGGF